MGGRPSVVVSRYPIGELYHRRRGIDRTDVGRLDIDAGRGCICRVPTHIDEVSVHAIKVVVPGSNSDLRRIGPVEDYRGEEGTGVIAGCIKGIASVARSVVTAIDRRA